MEIVDKIVYYIENEMDFYSYQDFCDNAVVLKKMYTSLKPRIRTIYMWYVYSKTINYSFKSKIWEYLNNDITLEELIEYEKTYKKSKSK